MKMCRDFNSNYIILDRSKLDVTQRYILRNRMNADEEKEELDSQYSCNGVKGRVATYLNRLKSV